MGLSKRRLAGQLHAVLAHLIKHRTITNREAMLNLGVGRLASRISELRALGVVVVTGHPETSKRHAEYELGDVAAAIGLLAGRATPEIFTAEINGGVPQPPHESVCDEGVSPVHPPIGAAPEGMSDGEAWGAGDNG